MKSLNSIFILLIFLFSCDIGVKPAFTEYTLVNSTPCTVEVIGYLNGEMLDSYEFDVSEDFHKSFSSSPKETVYPPPFEPYVDSCVVVYCEKYSMTHLRSYEDPYFSSPIKSLFNDDDYEIKASGESVSYVFEFIEEDYERALKQNRNINP